MNNILVVSGDKPFLAEVESEFVTLASQYRLFTAGDGMTGLKILKKEPIDFVCTSLILPQMDGFEFLSYLRQIKPTVPTVVMTSDEATYMGDSFLKMGVLKVLLEPVSTSRLIDCIQEVLFLKTQQGRLQGISIINFLQLIEMEKKTYLLEVRNPAGGMGLFYFHEGVLFDALCGERTSEEAALEMITWENVEIHFRTPPTKKVKKRITKSLMSLLMDGVFIKDTKADRQTAVGENEDDTFLDDAISEAIEPRNDIDFTDLMSFDDLEEPSPPEPPIDTIDAKPSLEKEPSPNVDDHLQKLYTISGVRAVILISPQKEVLSSVGSWPGMDLADFANSVALVHGGAIRMVNETELAGLNTLTLESDGAVIICSPAGNNLLVVLAPNSKTLGIIRQKTLKEAGEIGRLLP